MRVTNYSLSVFWKILDHLIWILLSVLFYSNRCYCAHRLSGLMIDEYDAKRYSQDAKDMNCRKYFGEKSKFIQSLS